MIGYILSVFGNMLGALIVGFIPCLIYFSLKEAVRQSLHARGYRVYTKEELLERDMIPEITEEGDVVIVDAQVIDKDDNVIEIKPKKSIADELDAIADDIDEELHHGYLLREEIRKRKRRKIK